MPDNDNGSGGDPFAGYKKLKAPYKPENIGGLEVFDAGEDDEDIPPREWLLGNCFARGFLGGCIGDGGVGKTALRILMYLSMATNRALTGHHVFQRARVLLVCLEDDRTELRRRIKAAMMHYKIGRADLKGWLYYATPRGVKLAELKEGSPAIGKLEGMIRSAVAELEIAVVGFDPLVKAHAVDENKNVEMDFVADLLTQIASDLNVATDICHHTKKGTAVAGDADAGRGAGATKNAGRLMYTLTRMTPKEAETFGIGERERLLYVRHNSGKVNLAPPSMAAEWFKLVGVSLGNGNDRYPHGDNVQTVECWEPPQTFEGVNTAIANAILDEIDSGLEDGSYYSSANSAGAREARLVVQRHMPEKTDPEARKIIKTWLTNGLLYKDTWPDPKSRKPHERLRVNHTKRPGTRHDA
jgi:hypothetical protein